MKKIVGLLGAVLLLAGALGAAFSKTKVQPEAVEAWVETREIMADPVPTAPEQAETFSILLIGQDKKPEEPGTRSDSMILCTLCPSKKTMTMTSILRDLYVEIPGYGKNRVNAAYAFGGTKLLEKTLEKNLGVKVKGSVEVDFNQFSKLMDLLGGVPMEIRKDEAKEINRVVPGSDLHEGSAVLSGDQALAYARIRKLDPDSDVSRSKRQRKVLEEIYRQYRSATAKQLISVLRQALPMVTTNLRKSELLGFAGTLLPMMGELKVESFRIPADGTYRDLNVDHMAVLDADLSANRRLLQKIQNPAP